MWNNVFPKSIPITQRLIAPPPACTLSLPPHTAHRVPGGAALSPLPAEGSAEGKGAPPARLRVPLPSSTLLRPHIHRRLLWELNTIPGGELGFSSFTQADHSIREPGSLTTRPRP